jgi:hypothetical protein
MHSVFYVRVGICWERKSSLLTGEERFKKRLWLVLVVGGLQFSMRSCRWVEREKIAVVE